MDPRLTLSALDLVMEAVRVSMHRTAGQNPSVLSCTRWVAAHESGSAVAFGVTLFSRAAPEGKTLQLVPPPQEMMHWYTIPGENYPALYFWSRLSHTSRKFPLAFYRQLRVLTRGLPRVVGRGATDVLDFRAPELQPRLGLRIPVRGYMLRDKKLRLLGCTLPVSLHPDGFESTELSVAEDWPRAWLKGDDLKKALLSEPRRAVPEFT